MKKYILQKKIFAVLFLLVMFGYSAVNLMHSYEPVTDEMEELGWSVDTLDTAITESMYGRMNFI